MILQSSATLQLLSALVEVGAAGGSREHLIRKAGLGTTTFYRLLKPLVERGLVEEQDGRYVLPLSQEYNFRFKLWHDLERLYDLEEPVRAEILAICGRARQELGETLRCIWLVGSAAHGALGSQSDLDFLAVVRKDVLYHPAGTRAINFVLMDEAEFRAKHRAQDNFVLAALQYGLVLFDHGFAQEAYVQSAPVTLTSGRIREREDQLELHRERFHFFVRAAEDEEAAKALAAYATSLARLMLQTFGELPAGKTETLLLSSRLFGARFGETLARAVRQKTRGKALMGLHRRLADYQDRFQKQAAHLKTFASLLSGGALEFEERTQAVLRELAGAAPDRELRAADGTVLSLVECKVRERGLEEEAVTSARRAHYPGAGRLLLVANTYRRLPLLERPPALSEETRRVAEEAGVEVWSGEDLLRTHNRLHLENVAPAVALRELLPAG